MRPVFDLAVTMERRELDNVWQTVQWTAVEIEVLSSPADGAAAPQLICDEPQRSLWLHRHCRLELFPDEAEGYFLNLSTPQPFLFVMWRMEGEQAVPRLVTASYNEASRMLDAGEMVDGLAMPAAIRAEAECFMLKHYKPQRRERVRPPSFTGARRDS